jgi:hypothetical protein
MAAPGGPASVVLLERCSPPYPIPASATWWLLTGGHDSGLEGGKWLAVESTAGTGPDDIGTHLPRLLTASTDTAGPGVLVQIPSLHALLSGLQTWDLVQG